LILVTAANGKTGRKVVRVLADLGQDVRALDISEDVAGLAEEGATETLAGDVLDPGTLTRAMAGVSAVVQIGPPFHPAETAMGHLVIDAARREGVERFVYFSIGHPEIATLVNHKAKLLVEEYLVRSGLSYTILQPIHYMQNLPPKMIAAGGVLRMPYSLDTPVAFVDLDDVAEVAAKVATHDGHAYATYPLSGSDILSGREVAALIAEKTGKEIRGEEVNVDQFLATISGGQQLPPFVQEGFERLFAYFGSYGITGNPNTLSWLLGRAPTTFAEYVERELNGAA
jgi:uncharacterized protein YbjT (DUF2867 family)